MNVTTTTIILAIIHVRISRRRRVSVQALEHVNGGGRNNNHEMETSPTLYHETLPSLIVAESIMHILAIPVKCRRTTPVGVKLL